MDKRAFNEISASVGHTPLVFLPSLSSPKVKIFAKKEWEQIGGSVKARAAFSIIRAAAEGGMLEDKILLDASSGNTAIAYASIGARLGIPVEICLPENASQKRKDYLKILGAKLTYTSPLEGTDGAQAVAKSMAESNPEKYYYADQYNNENNWKAHYNGTAKEIFKQTEGSLTHFITGLGTTGSFVGTAAGLKALDPTIKTIALGPESPMHFLEGWKHLETAVVPGIYSKENIDDFKFIPDDGVLEMIRHLASKEGLLVSPSSAANALGAMNYSKEIKEGVIVTLFPDDLSKYDEIIEIL
jgi:cysteine synthase B